MNSRFRLSLMGVVLALAATLTFFKIPLASSQGLTLVAAEASGNLPVTDPGADLWQKATAIEVPLSAQTIVRPILPETKVKSVTVRALYNQAELAFLVEWPDETQDDQMVRIQDFRDAVALQFPLAEGEPYFCMGQQGGNVNIWHWKADWQTDIMTRQDMDTQYPNMYVDGYTFAEPVTNIAAGPGDYTDPNYLTALAAGNAFALPAHDSPVEDLVAGGFGTLTAQPIAEQNVQGHGAWADGKWQVIFSRDLTSTETDDINFTLDRVYSVAFAAWDGANEERNGQKSTSQWVSFQFEGAAVASTQPSEGQESSPSAVPAAEAESSIAGSSIMVLLFVSITLGFTFLIGILFLVVQVQQRQ